MNRSGWLLTLLFTLLTPCIHADEPRQLDKSIKHWKQQLTSPDERVRAEAIEQLLFLGAPASDFVPLMRDPKDAIRGQARSAIELLKQDCIAELTPIMKDPNLEIRRNAIYTVHALKQHEKSAVPALTLALDDTDSDIKRYSAYILGELGPAAQAAVPALRKLAKSADEVDRHSGRTGLVRIAPDDPQTLEFSVTALGVETDRSSAVEEFRHLGSRGVPALILALKDKNAIKRRGAAEALAILSEAEWQKHPRSAIPALLQTLKETDEPIRTATLNALARMVRLADLVPVVNHADKNVRAGVLRLVAGLTEDEVVKLETLPLWRQSLSDPEEEVRWIASEPLKKIGVRAAPYLLQAAQDEKSPGRARALTLLIDAGIASSASGYRLIPPLLALTSDKNPEVRASAIIALSRIDHVDPAVEAAFARGLRDPDPKVQMAAAEAAGRRSPLDAESVAVLIKIRQVKREDMQDLHYAADRALREAKMMPAARPVLEKALLVARDDALLTVAWALSGFGKEAAPTLRQALKDGSKERRTKEGEDPLRVAVMAALQRDWSGPENAPHQEALATCVPELLMLLKDANPRTRHEAAITLGRYPAQAKQTVPALMAALQDRETRPAALGSLTAFAPHSKEVVAAAPALADLLRDPDPSFRQAVVRTFEAMGPAGLQSAPKAAPLIVAMLGDQDYYATASTALKKLGKGVLPALKPALSDTKRPMVCVEAASILMHIQPTHEEIMPALLLALKSTAPAVRQRAVSSLREHNRRVAISPAVLIGLLNDLKNADQATHASLLELASEMAPVLREQRKEVLTALAQHLRRDEPYRSASAAGPMAKFGPEAIPYMTGSLKELRPDGFRAVLAILITTYPRECSPAFTQAMEHKSEDIRRSAAYMLSENSTAAKHMPDLVARLLHDKDSDVRRYAARSLRLCGPEAKRAIPALRLALDAEQSETRQLAACMLVGLGEDLPRCLPIVLRTFRARRNADEASYALAALNARQAKEAVPLLAPALHDPLERVNQFVAHILSRLGDEGIAVLVKGLAAPERSTGHAALHGLRQLKQVPPQATSGLRLLLKDAEPRIRIEAALSLAQLGDTDKTMIAILLDEIKLNSPHRDAVIQSLAALGKDGERALSRYLQLPDLDAQIYSRIHKLTADETLLLDALALANPDRPPPGLHVWEGNPFVESSPEIDGLGQELIPTLSLKKLGEPGPEVFKALKQALKSPEKRIRIRAVTLLGALEAEAAGVAPEIAGLLTDANPLVRIAVVDTLARIGPAAKVALPGVRQALMDSDDIAQIRAALALTRISGDSKESLPILERWLMDPDYSTAYAASEVLYGLAKRTPEAVPLLVKGLQRKDSSASSGALSRLGKQALPTLLPELKHPVRRARSEVVSVLGYMLPGEANEAVPALMEVLKDPDWDLRQQTLQVVVRITKDARPLLPMLREGCNHADVKVRNATISTVAQFGKHGEPAVPLLTDLLKDTVVQAAAANALRNIGPAAKPAIPALLPLLRHESSSIRSAAAAALRDIGPTAEAMPALREAARDPDSSVRSIANEALRKGPP